MDESETFSDLGGETPVEEPTKLIFEQGGVSQKFTSNKNRRKKETLIPGKLLLTENKFGLFIEWKPEENSSRNSCSPDPSSSNSRPSSSNSNGNRDWAMVHGAAGGGIGPIGFHAGKEEAAIEFVPDPQAADYRRPIKIEFLEIRSFLIPSRSHEKELIFILSDGTTQNPFIFERSTTENLVCALHRHATIKRARHNKELYLVTPKKEETMTRSSPHTSLVAELFPEHTHQFNQVYQLYTDLRNDPKALAFTALAKIADYALSDRENGSDHTPENSNGHSPRSPMVTENLDADYTTNDDGYEVIFKPEKLDIELGVRPNTFRGQPLSQEQWLNYLDNEGRVKQFDEVKQIIFLGGVDPAIRKHVWVFLLGVYSSSSSFEERKEQFRDYTVSYNRMKTQWASITEDQEERFHAFRDFKSLIEKDVLRTDKTIEYYQDEKYGGSEILRNILMTYLMYNFNLGYVQGMSDILSPILLEIQDEVLAFWIFVKFMDRIHTNFEMSQEGMQRQLRSSYTLLQLVDPRFSAYLDACDASNMYFAFRWLLILYKREFSTFDIMTLWEALWTQLPGPNFQLFIGLAILEKHRTTVMENKFGLSEILRHVNDLSLRIDLCETLSTAEAIYRQILNVEEKLPNNIRVIIGLAEKEESSPETSSASFTPDPDIGPGSGDGRTIIAASSAQCQSPTVEEQSLELNCDLGMSQFM